MKTLLVWISVFVVAAIGGGLYFLKWRADPGAWVQQQPQTAEVTQPPADAPPAQEIRNPLPQTESPPEAEPKPLPQLAASDDTMLQSLTDAMGSQAVADLVISKDIVRRIVTTVDNLPRKKVAERLIPVKRPAGQTITNGEGAFVSLSQSNYARYAPYARMARGTDTKKLVAAYVHFYPLFQKVYQDLGYPRKYFNDRVIEVIDDLLATPEVREPVDLLRPKVLYEFADPQLEELSAGQKIMLRMGAENAAVVKAKLREIRREVAAEAPSAQR